MSEPDQADDELVQKLKSWRVSGIEQAETPTYLLTLSELNSVLAFIESLQKEKTRLTELKEWLFREFNRLFTAMDKYK